MIDDSKKVLDGAKQVVEEDDLILRGELEPPNLDKGKMNDVEWLQWEFELCCGMTKQYENLRESITKFWTTFNGILFVAISFAISDCNSRVSSFFLIIVGLVGASISYMSLRSEKREMDYFSVIAQRMSAIELRLRRYGFWLRIRNKLVVNKAGSRRDIMEWAYIIGIVFWILVAVISIWFTINNDIWADIIKKPTHT